MRLIISVHKEGDKMFVINTENNPAKSASKNF